jgi:diacylglycerol kinase family enzyme
MLRAMNPPRLIQLFVNPRSGRRAQRRVAALRAALETGGATLLVSESTAGRLEIDPAADHVCAVGGDGTLRHVVEAVHRAGRPISVSTYPGGTVNLLARECGYPRSPDAFAQRLRDPGAGRGHHTALIGITPLLACASVGPDSIAVERLSATWKRRIGRSAYLLAFCAGLLAWKRTRIILLHDGRETVCEAVYIAKGRYFAGPWSFAPAARVDDPRLHVVALRRASRLTFLRFAWTLLRRRPVEVLAGVDMFACTELIIRSEAPLPLQADGDIVAHLPATIRMRPGTTMFA